MIIERHLRIGNFVARNDSDEFVISEVLGIARNFEWEYLIDSRNRDGRRREAGWISAIKCDPIPLTPEWLERCGFKKRKSNTEGVDDYVLGNIIIEHEVDHKKYNAAAFSLAYDQDGLIVYPLSYHPEHLHQLQNLYFALTGEELQIKMP